MKQVLQSYRTGELWLAEVDAPHPAPGGARIHTRASLISAGTEKYLVQMARKSLVGKAQARPDLVKRVLQKVQQEGLQRTIEQVQEKLNTPIAMGYSSAGVVMDAEGVGDLRPGTRVACAGAGYAAHAEVNWVPRNLLVPLPDGVSFEEGACATVGAIALQGVRQAELRLGDRVLVIGLGLIGNLTAQLAAASGARVFAFDLSQRAVELALQTGCAAGTSDATRVLDEVMAFTGGHGVDAVLIAASSPGNNGPVELAVQAARLRGKVIAVGLVGLEMPRDDAYRKELDLRMSMSYGPGRYDADYEERGQDYPLAYVRYTEQRNIQAFLEAVEDGRVVLGPILTHRFGIDQALDAYALLESDEPSVGVILEYGEPEAREVRPVARPASAAPGPRRVATVNRAPGIGLIGAGTFVRGVLLPSLRRTDARLVGVVNRTGPSAENVRKGSGFSWGGTDAERVFTDAAIDAVVIGTRHRLHAPLSLKALEAGKHVFVEKPVCVTPDELSALVVAQRRADRLVQVGTNRRFSPYVAKVREVFAGRADPLSIQYRVNAGQIPADHWVREAAEGGGRLVAEGVHFIDVCQAVVGAPVSRVSCAPMGGGPSAIAGDSFAITLEYTDGSVAQILYATEGDRGLPKERLEVFGGGKVAVVEDWSAGTVWSGGRQSKLRAPRGQQKGSVEQLSAFLQALATGVPAVPMDEVWHVHHVMFAAAAAMERGVPVETAWPCPDAP
ncbi:MAG: bi-domain-containing oxidoreductase [Deltaproteobacteria bacterium]|nr:bi-domain-containing oxidoreductase [Deltaproteobacteria bacterium]